MLLHILSKKGYDKMSIYLVKAGDSVDSIAEANGVTTEILTYANQIPYPYELAVGQAVLIPDGAENPAEDEGSVNRQVVVTNGYAYPFISDWVLEQTLPYLTELSVFSYGFTAAGNLIAPLWDDEPLIWRAQEFGTAPILTLTPFDENGQFNNYLVSVITNDMEAQSNLIAQLLRTAGNKGYAGIDIDFEYVRGEDRETFAAFVSNVRVAANAGGYTVSVALAPKVADDQPGLLYEGIDYALLGEAANSVMLMTYEWGYTYGPPMAVAPINKVREVVEYALSRIPADKISLGIPNYGYNWALPYQRGVTRATTIGNVEAVQIAIHYGVPIQFDELAMTPFFRYYQNGAEHEVWFEDVRSMREKFNLVQQYGLRGMGCWQIMQLFRANWLLLADTFWIQKADNLSTSGTF